MPYLTPDELPEETACRSLSIPANVDWLAIVSGALTELTKTYNWQQRGAVTVDEAVEAMTAMIDAYYSGCDYCTTPGGYRVIRINQSGQLEQLNTDGEWEPATDEYYIPPPAAREGGSPEDQMCLAAKNAENALHELYSNISESFDEELTEAAALVSLATFAVGLIGFEFAPITFGIAAIIFGAWSLLYSAVSYLTADLWDENFTDQITCFLLTCASNTDGVITFDWECFNNQLYTLADDFGLTEIQIRLYLQVAYMLQFIGGGAGLDLAGGTTAISDDDCDMCDQTWCYTFDFEASNGGFVSNPRDGSGWGATYVSSTGWQAGAAFAISLALPTGGIIHQIVVECDNGTVGFGHYFESSFPNADGSDTINNFNSDCGVGAPGGLTWTLSSGEYFTLQRYTGTGTVTVTRITFSGEGENPFGTDNCP